MFCVLLFFSHALNASLICANLSDSVCMRKSSQTFKFDYFFYKFRRFTVNFFSKVSIFSGAGESSFWKFIWAFLTNLHSERENTTQFQSIDCINNKLNSLLFVNGMSERNETGFDFLSFFHHLFPAFENIFHKIIVFWFETFSSRVICGIDCFSVRGFQFLRKIYQFWWICVALFRSYALCACIFQVDLAEREREKKRKTCFLIKIIIVQILVKKGLKVNCSL